MVDIPDVVLYPKCDCYGYKECAWNRIDSSNCLQKVLGCGFAISMENYFKKDNVPNFEVCDDGEIR